ncbi:MAG: LCP family protein [Candidatus Saganbacteria bacterium]|nr:LCP family protein [Candidatus Saganbacteria bacterium]
MAGRRLTNIQNPSKIVLISLMSLIIATGLFIGIKRGLIKENDQINVLVMGIDTKEGLKTRSDSINLVHIDFARSRMGILSIPRDTLVDIPGHGQDKINHAHTYGGPELSCATVSNFLKIPVYYYIEVNFPMFVDLVDRIGGVTLDVEKPLYYDDYAADLHIHLSQGRQRLSGYETMGYVRFRHDRTSDWGRIDRQHKFFEALAKELMRPSNLIRFPYILYTMSSNVRTNMGISQAARIALKISSIYRTGTVVTGVIPGGDARLERGYYMLSDEEGMRKEIERVIYGR